MPVCVYALITMYVYAREVKKKEVYKYIFVVGIISQNGIAREIDRHAYF